MKRLRDIGQPVFEPRWYRPGANRATSLATGLPNKINSDIIKNNKQTTIND